MPSNSNTEFWDGEVNSIDTKQIPQHTHKFFLYKDLHEIACDCGVGYHVTPDVIDEKIKTIRIGTGEWA